MAISYKSSLLTEKFAERLFCVKNCQVQQISMNKTDATHLCPFTHALSWAYSAFSLFSPHSRSCLSFRPLLKSASFRKPSPSSDIIQPSVDSECNSSLSASWIVSGSAGLLAGTILQLEPRGSGPEL